MKFLVLCISYCSYTIIHGLRDVRHWEIMNVLKESRCEYGCNEVASWTKYGTSYHSFPFHPTHLCWSVCVWACVCVSVMCVSLVAVLFKNSSKTNESNIPCSVQILVLLIYSKTFNGICCVLVDCVPLIDFIAWLKNHYLINVTYQTQRSVRLCNEY